MGGSDAVPWEPWCHACPQGLIAGCTGWGPRTGVVPVHRSDLLAGTVPGLLITVRTVHRLYTNCHHTLARPQACVICGLQAPASKGRTAHCYASASRTMSAADKVRTCALCAAALWPFAPMATGFSEGLPAAQERVACPPCCGCLPAAGAPPCARGGPRRRRARRAAQHRARTHTCHLRRPRAGGGPARRGPRSRLRLARQATP